jgi:hypothetical protein
MSSLKHKLILISVLIIFVLHLYCLIAKVNFYPFVEYNMFSVAKTSPTYKTLYLYGIDGAGNDFSLDQNKKYFFKPFNQRGFYHALQNSVREKGVKNILAPLAIKANQTNSLIKGLRLYGLACNCANSFELETIGLPQYLTQNCKRWFIDEVRLE